MATKPLSGCKIIVTRSQDQASSLIRLLQQEGATVYSVPAIEVVELKEGMQRLQNEFTRIAQYSWLLFTSANTVSFVDRLLRESGWNWKLFENLKIGCIGTSTARKVKQFGGSVALVPPLFQAENLVEELLKQDPAGQHILLPRAAGSRPVLPVELQKGGAIVEEIHIYTATRPQHPTIDLSEILQNDKIHFLTFTSSSTVRNFAELAGDLAWQKIPVACIGPITAQTLREYGIEPAVEAAEFTIPGLVAAIKSYVATSDPGRD